MTLGDFVRNYRDDHKISQRSFAKACGVSNGYISMIEKGINPKTNEPITPTLPMLRSIASGMGLTAHELLTMVDDMDLDITMQKTPAPESGLDELVSMYQELSPDNRAKLLELCHLFLDAQSKKQ